MIPVVVVIVIAVLFGGVLWVAPRWHEWRRPRREAKPQPTRKNDLLWTYVIALAATVIGVYLALYQNRIETQAAEARQVAEREKAEVRQSAEREDDEHKRAFDLLTKATTDIYSLREDVRTLYWAEAWTGDKRTSIRAMLRATPLQSPRALDIALGNDLVLRLASSDGYASMRNAQDQIVTMVRIVNGQSDDNAAIRPNLDILGMTLSIEAHWVGAEKMYLNNRMTDGERNAYGTRWAMYEVVGDTAKATWARLRATRVVAIHGAIRTTVGHYPSVDVLLDSLPHGPE